jgi:hypothetical protein
MAASRGIHEHVPSSLLAGRWLLVLVCYLDDSGKDPQNRATTLAGYVARDTAWQAFEKKVEPVFKRHGVSLLHAKELEATDGEFKGWKVLKKQAFVAEICSTLAKHSMLGVSMSAIKKTYDRQAKKSCRKRTNRPYTFCMNVIIDWLLRDIRTGRAAWTEGVALILECGHENNPEAEQAFHSLRKKYKLEGVLHSISFVPKEDCRAIQMADLLSFYSRREANAKEKAERTGRKAQEMEQMLKIITEKGPFRGFVATDFSPPS